MRPLNPYFVAIDGTNDTFSIYLVAIYKDIVEQNIEML